MKINWKKGLGDLALLTLMALWDRIKDKVEDWRKGK